MGSYAYNYILKEQTVINLGAKGFVKFGGPSTSCERDRVKTRSLNESKETLNLQNVHVQSIPAVWSII